MTLGALVASWPAQRREFLSKWGPHLCWKLARKLDPLGDALRAIAGGATAASDESESLDFKRDPHSVTGRGALANPQARLIEELVDGIVCFANTRGGRIVLGFDYRTPGKGAFIGTCQPRGAPKSDLRQHPAAAHGAD